MAFCTNCGAQLAPESRFCSACGTQVSSNQVAANQRALAAQDNTEANNGSIASGLANMAKTFVDNRKQVYEQSKESTSFVITMVDRCDLIGARPNSQISFNVLNGGYIWFNKMPNERFQIVGYAWGGPYYQQQIITNTEQISKRKGGIGSAVVGGAIAGGAGAIIGAGLGSKNVQKGTSVSTFVPVEIPTVATVSLRNARTGEIANFRIQGLSAQLAPLSQLVWRRA